MNEKTVAAYAKVAAIQCEVEAMKTRNEKERHFGMPSPYQDMHFFGKAAILHEIAEELSGKGNHNDNAFEVDRSG